MFRLAFLATLATAVLAGGSGQIKPVKNSHKCLDVAGANFIDGQKVQLWDCNGTNAQRWHINSNENPDGYGSISINGPDGRKWCLDRGDVGADGTKFTIKACRGRVPAQTWQYHPQIQQIMNDDRVRCFDVTDGNTANGARPQVWTCSVGNPNQAWTFH